MGPWVLNIMCECGYVSKSRTGIRLHRRAVHGDDAGDLDRAPDLHQCGSCKKTFANEFRMLDHFRHSDPCTHHK